MNPFFDFIKLHSAEILVLFFAVEYLLRIIPTFKNLSLLDKIRLIMNFLHDLFNKIVPNKIKDAEQK
jgi:hypothetical protein